MNLRRALRKHPSLQLPFHLLGVYQAHTQTTRSERDALAEFARGRSSLAEIGVLQGATARRLSSVMDPNGTYYAIDPYGGGRFGVDFNYVIARREVAKDARGRVEWIRTTGAEAPNDPRLQGCTVDFLFIDGDHSYDGLRGDWEAWRDLVAPGGIVGLHDTRGGRFGCQRYMEEVIIPDEAFNVVAEVHSLTVLRRAA